VCVALVIQDAMRMRHRSSVACSTLPYFSTLSHKRQGFREKNVTEYRMWFHFLYNVCLKTFLILGRTEQDLIESINWSSDTVRYSSQILMKAEVSRQFF
jgi:hypothetical protein